jgi:hypothetical protein
MPQFKSDAAPFIKIIFRRKGVFYRFHISPVKNNIDSMYVCKARLVKRRLPVKAMPHRKLIGEAVIILKDEIVIFIVKKILRARG